ncbi:hypothetical protein MKX03_035018, partial [Papaver bracteatum]
AKILRCSARGSLDPNEDSETEYEGQQLKDEDDAYREDEEEETRSTKVSIGM